MQTVGYFLNHPGGHQPGVKGECYDYLFAGNGVLIEAENALLQAKIPVVNCAIKGLLPAQPEVLLKNGKIPIALFDLALSHAMTRMQQETYFAITWKEGGYHLFLTPQKGQGAQVEYTPLPDTIMDLHSHPTFQAQFSGTDNKDEQGMRLSLLMGNLDRSRPLISLRIAVYGSYLLIPWTDAFSGILTSAIDTAVQGQLQEITETIELRGNNLGG